MLFYNARLKKTAGKTAEEGAEWVLVEKPKKRPEKQPKQPEKHERGSDTTSYKEGLLLEEHGASHSSANVEVSTSY